MRWNSVWYLQDVKMTKLHLTCEMCCVCTVNQVVHCTFIHSLSPLPIKHFCPSIRACSCGSCMYGLSTSTQEAWARTPAVPLSHLVAWRKWLPLSYISYACVCKQLGQDLSHIICTRGLSNCRWVSITEKNNAQLPLYSNSNWHTALSKINHLEITTFCSLHTF